MRKRVKKQGGKKFTYISKENIKIVNLYLISIGFISLLLILEIAYYYVN